MFGFPTVQGSRCLKNISFRVRPGEKVALVGATGGGKTSIISRFADFTMFDQGAILVDGIDVRDVEQARTASPHRIGVAGRVSFFRRFRELISRSAIRTFSRRAHVRSGTARAARAFH